MRAPIRLLAGAAGVLAIAGARLPQETLTFARYPARVYHGRPAAVDLRSTPGARRFRTVLRIGAARGPNFAGDQTIVTWGCGTNCGQLAVVSARTGRVVLADFDVEDGVHYRHDSEPLVVDPYACAFTEQELPGRRWQRMYRWRSGRLVFLDSLAVPPGQPCDAR